MSLSKWHMVQVNDVYPHFSLTTRSNIYSLWNIDSAENAVNTEHMLAMGYMKG